MLETVGKDFLILKLRKSIIRILEDFVTGVQNTNNISTARGNI